MVANSNKGHSLVEQLDRAIADLGKGQFSGNLVQLLTKARDQLTAHKAEVRDAQADNAKAMSAAHRKFTERLSNILAEKVKLEDMVEGETLSYCYAGDWYHNGPYSDGREATITIRDSKIRISTDEEIAPPNSRIEYGEYGAYRELRHVHWTFPERWLWEDDWKVEFKRRGLQVALLMARRHREDAIKRRDDLVKKGVPQAEQRIAELTKECEQICAKMKAEGMPALEEDL